MDMKIIHYAVGKEMVRVGKWIKNDKWQKTKKKVLRQTFKKLLFRACLFKKIIWYNLGIKCTFKIQLIR